LIWEFESQAPVQNRCFEYTVRAFGFERKGLGLPCKVLKWMEKVKNYILESIDEIRNKVSWPKFNELQSSAILVLVASLIFAFIIGVIDLGFNNALSWFYREF
jgi:preprotein translocase subunit SecE